MFSSGKVSTIRPFPPSLCLAFKQEELSWEVLATCHSALKAVLEWHVSHFGAAMLKILTAGKEE